MPQCAAITTNSRRIAGISLVAALAAAGLVTFLVIWLVHGYIYRWPSTRRSDEDVDAALTRFAWPGYRLVQRWLGRETGPAPSA